MKSPKFIILLFVLMVFMASASPCFAYGGVGEYGLGAGVMMPDIEAIDANNAIYYLFDFTSMDFLFEVNFVNESPMDAWLIHGDYKYPLSGLMGTEAYLGFGYSYLFADSDELDDDSGINLCIGLNLQKNIDIRGRYLFLGGGDHIFTAGATMYF